MSKVITHTRRKIAALRNGQAVRTKPHNHLTLSHTGYIPTGSNTVINLKKKR
jgi:hypothetical protein